MILLMSGLMIFNAHPHLYLGHTSEPDKALLSIGATEHGGEPRGYLEIYGHRRSTPPESQASSGPLNGTEPTRLSELG